jgi:hypothetical protein
LSQLTINLTPAGLKFDSSKASGFPFTLGNLTQITPGNITTNVPANTASIPSITLFFNNNSFKAGTSVSFGIDRDFIGDGGGNGGDLLQGATISAGTSKGSLGGTFVNNFGKGWSFLDGFGLIDAVKAAQAVP